MKRSSLALMLTCSFFVQSSMAQLLSEESIRSIERLADVICSGFQDSGSNTVVSINANAEAEVRAILRLLGGAEGGIDIDEFVSKYQNVPRSELADQLRSVRECRMEVFLASREEVAKSVTPLLPQQDKLVWTFPHIVKNGLALGVINVRTRGLGVDVNFRLRNVRSEPIYVKFSWLSYTDRTGNVCQDGSFTTGISGIAWRESHDPDLLPAGESIQFSGDNIRCDGQTFGDTGDILATVLAGKEPDELRGVKYEIAGVAVRGN